MQFSSIVNKVLNISYSSQDEFFESLSQQSAQDLLKILEVIDQNPQKVNDHILADRIITHLEKRESLEPILANQVSDIAKKIFSKQQDIERTNTSFYEYMSALFSYLIRGYQSFFGPSQKVEMSSHQDNSAFIERESLQLFYQHEKALPILVSKIRLPSGDPTFAESEKKIYLPEYVTRQTFAYLREFFEKGTIKDCHKITQEHCLNLMKLALEWQLTRLIDEMSKNYFFPLTEQNFDYYFNMAMNESCLNLFEKCLRFTDIHFLLKKGDVFEVDLSNYECSSPDFHDELDQKCQFLHKRMQKNPNMKKIRFGISFKPLSDSKEINPHVINAWPNSLKNLITDLYIEEISEAKQSCFFNTYAKSCLGQCPNIKSIETIVTKLPIQIDRTVGEKITYIKIEGNVEDYDFQFLSSHCSNLKKLHLGYQPENPIISKQAILFLEHMSGLTMFIAPHFIIPEDTIKNLKQTWPYLRKLELKNLDQFT